MRSGTRLSLRVILLIASLATLWSVVWISRYVSPGLACLGALLVLLLLRALGAAIPCVRCGQSDSPVAFVTKRFFGLRQALQLASSEGVCLWCRRSLEAPEPPSVR